MDRSTACALTPDLPTPAEVRLARETRVGALYGIAAYGFWGLVPLYFKAVERVAPLEVLAHRVLWSVAFLAVLMVVRRNWRTAIAAVRDRRTLLILSATTVLIAVNWVTFIYAVAHDQVMQASLGYFINPLLSVLLGFVFLRERLRRWQQVSVGLAAVGVTYLALASGVVPGLALIMASTFGFYGLLRKIARVDTLSGLTVETSLLLAPALAFLVVQMARGQAAFGAGSARLDLLLMAAGLITAVPLLWFAAAAHRLPLATLGFLQYLAPTGHFLLAVLAFGEPFTHVQMISFGCIWTALVLYSADAVRNARPVRVSPAPID